MALNLCCYLAHSFALYFCLPLLKLLLTVMLTVMHRREKIEKTHWALIAITSNGYTVRLCIGILLLAGLGLFHTRHLWRWIIHKKLCWPALPLLYFSALSLCCFLTSSFFFPLTPFFLLQHLTHDPSLYNTVTLTKTVFIFYLGLDMAMLKAGVGAFLAHITLNVLFRAGWRLHISFYSDSRINWDSWTRHKIMH